MKVKIYLGAIFILIILALSLIFSQKVGPEFSPFFNLKRLQEKAFLKLQTNPLKKLDYMSTLLNLRLKEIENVVNNKNYDYVLSSSLRYSTLAGQITDFIIANNLKDKADSIKIKFEDHQKVLNNLYIAYPKNTDNVEYKYLEDDINYLDLYLDKLSKVK